MGPLAKDYPAVMPFVIAVISYPFTAAGIAAICAAYKIKTGKVTPAAAP